MTCSRWRSSWKRTSVFSSRPFRSMKTCLPGVHQDVGDLGILDQRLQRSQAEDLVQHLADQRLTLVEVERDHLLGDQVVDHLPDRLDDLVPAHPVQTGEVEPLDQPAVDPALDLLEVMRCRAGPRRRLSGAPRARRAGRPGPERWAPALPRSPKAGVPSTGGQPGERSRSDWRSFGSLLRVLASRPSSLPSGAVRARRVPRPCLLRRIPVDLGAERLHVLAVLRVAIQHDRLPGGDRLAHPFVVVAEGAVDRDAQGPLDVLERDVVLRVVTGSPPA